MSKARKISLVFVSILLFIGYGAAAAEVELEPNDDVIWLNDQVVDQELNAVLRCTADGEEVESFSILDSSSNTIYPKQDRELGGNSKEISFGPGSEGWDEVKDEPGKYFVKLECSSSKSSFQEFHYDRLDVEITSPDENSPIYTGTESTANVKLTSPAGQLNYADGFEYVQLSLEGAGQIGQEEIQFNTNTTVDFEVPKDAILGDSDLTAEVAYEETADEPTTWTEADTHQVEVNDWKIETEYKPDQRLPSNRLSELNMSIRIMREGEPVDSLGSRHFFIEQGQDSADTGEYEWFSGGLEGISSDGNFAVYNLKLEKMPKLEETKDYSLNVLFRTEENSNYERNVGTVHVAKKFTFEGRVSDSDSRAIQTAFKLQNDRYVEDFETDNRGFFSRRVMPGEYGMDVEFPKGSLVLNEVELGQDYSGNINYQYYKNPGEVEGVDLQGIDPINMMTVSFGYPFDSGTASMQYNPAKTEDPMNVDLYECQRWNFWGEECISGWDRVDEEDVTLPPTSWNAEFPVTPVETSEYGDQKKVLYSAYVIGTNSGLALDRIGLESYRVAEGKSFEVKGRAVTKGAPIENADVTVELLDGSTTVETASTTTDSEGTFSTSIDAPEAGNYSVRAEISKGSYDSYSETLDSQVEVYRQKSLEVKLPESYEVAPGETVEKTITLTNDGQMTFEDASIEVVESELDISFSDERFDLEPGDEKEVTTRASVPDGFCDPSCVKYPTADIGIEDGDFSEEYDLGVEIVDAASQSSTQQEEQQSDNESASSPFPDTPSGMVPANPVNFALGLLTVFSLALAAAVRKKKDSGNDRDSRTVNLQRPKVEPSESEDSEVDEVAGSMGDGDVDAIAQAMDDDSEAEDEEDEDEDIDELAEAMAEEESESDEPEEETELEDHIDEDVEETESEGDLSCDVCGEEFDTESGLTLHKKAFH